MVANIDTLAQAEESEVLQLWMRRQERTRATAQVYCATEF